MDTKILTDSTDLLLSTCSLEQLPSHLKQCWDDEKLRALCAKIRADTERRIALISSRADTIRGS